MTLILVAAEKEQHKYASVFLDAAYELDPERSGQASRSGSSICVPTTLRNQTVKFARSHVSRCQP